YYYNFSYEEIALILDIQVNSVKQKLHRARKAIHSKIGGKP
ncbi:RNA polymerase sigma factor, partial [Bacillus sp. GMa5/2]